MTQLERFLSFVINPCLVHSFTGSGAKTSRQWQLTFNLGHTDNITLKKVCDQYRKAKCIQVETLSA